MFDQYDSYSNAENIPFSFTPSRYEIWEKGQMTHSGRTDTPINSTIENDLTTINFQDKNLNDKLSKENNFELFRVGTDRLQLVSIPRVSNSSCVGLDVLKQFVGTTCEEKDFMYNDPYCCNIFTIDKQIAKLTFSFSTPERLLEFYQ